MDPSWQARSNDGSQVCAYELGGDGDVLLIAHATGLCGPMYQLLADELTHRFRVVALDFRGHGNSTRTLDTDLSWERMADDVLAVAERLGGAPIHAFGHSMGGGALLLAARSMPDTFRSLFLFEPIVFADDAPTDGQNVMGDGARRRRSTFTSRAEVLQRYASRPPFNQIRAGFLAAYVDHGFEDGPDGGVRLKCDPEVEARVFENGRSVAVRDVQHLALPIAVAIGHDEDGPNPARLGPPLVAALPHARLHRYQHIGHFGPFQDPWTVARDLVAHVQHRFPAGAEPT